MHDVTQPLASRGAFIKLCAFIAALMGVGIGLLTLVMSLGGMVNIDFGDGPFSGVMAGGILLVIIPLLFAPLGALTGLVAYGPVAKRWGMPVHGGQGSA